MPSASGVRVTCAPSARMIMTFSSEKLSGTNSDTLYPRLIPIRARPIPVFPAVASTITAPIFNFPSRSAARMIPIAARSLTLPPGFRYSSFTKTSAEPGPGRLRSRSIGVKPTSSVMFSATRRCGVVEGTLQGTEVERGGQRQEPWPAPGVQSPVGESSKLHFLYRHRNSLLARQRLEVANASLHRAFLTRVIPAAGADCQPFVRPSAGFHANRAIPADTLRRGWDIADGVLIADIASHRAADFIDVDEGGGKNAMPPVRAESV